MHGQLLFLGVEGIELSSKEAEILSKIQPGGFVLFGRNMESPEQVRCLTDDLREICEIEPIIAVDQEGGRVSRTRLMGSEPPSAQDLREKNKDGLIAQHGKLMAQVLQPLGFNMNLCPVLDISYDDEAENSLRGRCYGRDAQEVITNAGIFNRNLRRQGMLSCGKHFPSCGLANIDPHHGSPIVPKSLDEMLQTDLLPYTALMPELDSIMSCHAHFSAIDPESPGLPGTFSYNLLTKILRNQLGYNGVIVTDDLDMGAIVNTYGRGADIKLAISAGNDMAMICHQTDSYEAAYKHLKELPHSLVDDALLRIENMKNHLCYPPEFSSGQWAKINAEIAQLRIQVRGKEKSQTPDRKPNSPVEDY